MVAMSGAIMPAPLAMPLMVTVRLAEPGGGGRDLREGVGGHDRLGGVEPAAGRGARPPARPSRRRTCWRRAARRSRRSRRGRPRAGLQPAALAASLAVSVGRLAAGLAGEGIGVAGIDHQRARRAALELGAAPVDRRRRAFRAGEARRRPSCPGRTAPAARRCGPCSGCRRRRSRAARRRSAACREQSAGASGETVVDMATLSSCRAPTRCTRLDRTSLTKRGKSGRRCRGRKPGVTLQTAAPVSSSSARRACRGARSWRPGAAWRRTRSAPCASGRSRSGP